MKIKLGEIYKLSQSNQVVRIIGLDEYEVFYDFYWDHNNSWAFSSNLNKKGYFYRMALNNFLDQAIKVDEKELTKEELQVFKPELPLRLLRVNNVSWNLFSSKDKIVEFFKNDNTIDLEETIETDKIYLSAVSKQGKPKKAELIEAKGGKLTLLELLSNAAIMRSQLNLGDSDGIGIYRIGIEKKIPSYYIGNYIDMAGVMTSVA